MVNSTKLIHSINPAAEETMQSFPIHSKTQIEEMLQKAHQAFVYWREESFANRADLMKKVSEYLIQNKQRFSSIITKEMGWSLLIHDCRLAASSIPAMDGSFQISEFGNL
jgi:succinate-semialdehyde dehydrogenase/glutarate-semialdehyde dehydrogenase